MINKTYGHQLVAVSIISVVIAHFGSLVIITQFSRIIFDIQGLLTQITFLEDKVVRTKLTESFFTQKPKHFWFPSVLIIIMVVRKVRVITIHNEESIKITHLEKTYFRKNSLVCYCFC